MLADFGVYVIGLRADAMIVRDTSVHFDSDAMAFRLILRLFAMARTRSRRS